MTTKKKRGATTATQSETRKVKDNLINKNLFKGKIPSIVGKYICFVQNNGRELLTYVEKGKLTEFKKRKGKDFIRCAGVMQADPRP